MTLKFIFMLTRNDKTVEDARDHISTALKAGVKHIGFKDVGVSFDTLNLLNEDILRGGATSYLEVVSLDKQSEVMSAKAAKEIGVNNLLGGTNVSEVLSLIKGSNIKYFPFPGKIVGHPSVLEGSIQEIVKSSKDLASIDGVHGLDLLAYRHIDDPIKLMRAVTSLVKKPVIMAGSISSKSRIQDVKNSGAYGFTIGTAALDGDYSSKEQDLFSQLKVILSDLREVNS